MVKPLIDMVFAPVDPPMGTGANGKPYSSTVTSSPFTYNAKATVTLHIIGGTINVATYRSGAVSMQIGLLSTGDLLTLYPGESITITYLTAPTITIIPR